MAQNDKSGPVVIGNVTQIKRTHQYNCANCPRWDQLKEDQGICRLRIPTNSVIGVGEGIDRSPRPVTYPVYDITQANDVCALHPQLLLAEIVAVARAVFKAWDTRLAWDREKGFNRAPTLDEAMKFAADDGAESGKAA